MAKVHYFIEMWQGSQNLCAAQKKSQAQNKQKTAVGYISDTEELIAASWSNFQHDGAAAFKLSERSTLPPAVSVKDLPGGQTQVLNVRRIRRIVCHQVESDEDSIFESICDHQKWLNLNADSDNPNESEHAWKADDQSDVEIRRGIKASEWLEHRVVSASPNVPALIRPTRRSMKQLKQRLMNVSAMETRSNKGNKEK